jgi:PGF-CTERM protein
MTDPRDRRRSAPGTPAGRRSFLATVVGVLGASAAPAVAERSRVEGGAGDLDVRAKVQVDGLMNAVVGASGEEVYVAATNGFAVVDVSRPRRPTVLAERRGLLADRDSGPLRHVWDVKVSGDRLLVHGPAALGDDGAIAVFDVTDPAEPVRVVHHETGHRIHNAYLDGDVAYLTGTDLYQRPVLVVDVSDGVAEEVGRFTPADHGWTPREIHDVYVHDDVLYACYWDAGTWLVDVSEPSEPEPLVRLGFDQDAVASPSEDRLPGNDHYAQPNPSGDVLAIGKEAFAEGADSEGAPGGVELWDVSDPSDAARESIVAPPQPGDGAGARTAHNFGWRGNRLYTAWYSGGVRVLDASDVAEPRLLAGWRAEDASFWTAEPIHEGFVGADHASMSPDVEPGWLYVFPEPSSDGAVPAPRMDPAAPAVSTTDLASSADHTATSAASTTDPAPSEDTTASTVDRSPTTASPTRGTVEPSAEGTPGFGVTAALAGIGAGTYILGRRRSDGR